MCSWCAVQFHWHQLCPGHQAGLACHVQELVQGDHHLAQLRLVRLLEEFPDELASSVEAALAKVVHLLCVLLLGSVNLAQTFSSFDQTEIVALDKREI